jgi:hypothetical protein
MRLLFPRPLILVRIYSNVENTSQETQWVGLDTPAKYTLAPLMPPMSVIWIIVRRFGADDRRGVLR